MKKISVIILVSALVLGTFAGCVSDPVADDDGGAEEVSKTYEELFELSRDGELPDSYVSVFEEKFAVSDGEEVTVTGFFYADPLLKRDSDGAKTVNAVIEDTFGVCTVSHYTVTENDLLSFFSYDRSNYSGYGMYSYLYDLENDVLVDKEDYLISRGVDLDAVIAQANADAQRLVGSFDGAAVRSATSFDDGQWELFILDENTARIYYAEIVYGEDGDAIEPNPYVSDDVYITVTLG